VFDLSRYFVPGAFNSDALLEAWKWLLDNQPFDVFRVTCLGDMFLINTSGQVHFLDTIEGKLSLFAGSEEEFDSKLQNRHVRQRYLATFLVRDLTDAGVTLQAGECYSPDRPPILGGALSLDNLRPIDLLVHASIMGQIHRQVNNLPPGTPISNIVIE
jgi:hypothetical protein